MQTPVDLRSDTMTRPSAGMREAMARAEVGDDVWGEDPTIHRLEEEIAAIAGKDTALFVPSGTMSNQVALLCHTRPGDEVVLGRDAHIEADESGAAGAWCGVQLALAGQGGPFTEADVRAVIKPANDFHCASPSLIAIENTHNRSGGRVFPQADVRAIAAFARSRDLSLHLDGARLWNASIASGLSIAELAAPFDTVSLCLSKGLGAPVGSALCLPRRLRDRAILFRKRLGGGMRQAGILAAGALYALANNRERLAQDHEAARVFAARLTGLEGVRVVTPETNMVLIETPEGAAERLVDAAAKRGVLLGAMGPRLVRAAFHLDVRAEDVGPAADAAREALLEVLGDVSSS